MSVLGLWFCIYKFPLINAIVWQCFFFLSLRDATYTLEFKLESEKCGNSFTCLQLFSVHPHRMRIPRTRWWPWTWSCLWEKVAVALAETEQNATKSPIVKKQHCAKQRQRRKETSKYLSDLLALFRLPLFFGLRRSLLVVAVVSPSFVGSGTQVDTCQYPRRLVAPRSIWIAACHWPLLLAGLLLSILTLLRLTATDAAALPLLLLLHGQVLVRIVVDKLVHVTSVLTLQREASESFNATFNGAHGETMIRLSVTTLTRPPPPPFFFSLGISFAPSSKLSRFLVFSTYSARCSRSFFCSSCSLFRFSSYAGRTATRQSSWRVFEKQCACVASEQKFGSVVTDLFFHQLLTQQVPLLLLFGAEFLLLLILLPGSCHVVLSLTQQVGALPALGEHRRWWSRHYALSSTLMPWSVLASWAKGL